MFLKIVNLDKNSGLTFSSIVRLLFPKEKTHYMKAFFRNFYPTLDVQLHSPFFGKNREEVWQLLEDWHLPLDYSYFLTNTAGIVPKAPTLVFDRRHSLTIEQFLGWEAIEELRGGEEMADFLEGEYCPIATLKGKGHLLIGLDKVNALSGGIYYEIEGVGVVKVSKNLLEFLKSCTKQTPWTSAVLKSLVERNSIEQGQIQLSGFEAYPEAKYHQEILLIQQHQGQLEYLITRSSIVLFGEETKEYWLEELKSTNVDKVAYMQLAIKKIPQLQMTLNFGGIQEKITLYDIQEQRVIQQLLGFIIERSNR